MINEIILGDCLDVMKGIPSGQVDLLIADIPYDEVNRTSNGLRNLDKGAADQITFELNDFIDECSRVTSGSVYIFCGIEQVSEIRAKLVRNGLSTRLCIWEKTNPSPMNGQHIWLSSIECCVFGKKRGATFNEHCKGSVWRYSVPRGKLHPTMKPLPLMEYLIETSSKEGDLVLDPCMGSGTTGVACINTNRRFIGIELNEEYYNKAVERLNGAMVVCNE